VIKKGHIKPTHVMHEQHWLHSHAWCCTAVGACQRGNSVLRLDYEYWMRINIPSHQGI